MQKSLSKIFLALAFVFAVVPAYGQFNLKKAVGGAAKAVKAFTLTDAQMADYVKESVDWMDKNNPVLPEEDPYTQRLRRLTVGLTDADGIPLNFKVYNVVDINAFACPDGSVRVFSSLMDIMDDDELLGVIGHEIGHVIKRHSKNSFKQQLLTGALKDAVASTGGKAAALTETQLGTLSESLVQAKYSQKHENEADDCAYDFLIAKGKNPWGMIKAFEKLQSMEGNSSTKQSYISKMFSSHPETQSRIAHLASRCEKDGIARPAEKAE